MLNASELPGSAAARSHRPMHVVAILAAGGRGLRLGGDTPKQFLAIGGRAVLDRSVGAFVDHARVHEVVVALPSDVLAHPPAYLRDRGKPVLLVAGGERRQDSVANAFAVVADRADVIVIHDAARPFVDAAVIDRAIDAAVESGAAVAALPARDTVKLAERATGGGAWSVAHTLDRETIWLAQTPQAFTRAVLAEAIALAREGASGTDEAALVEQAGHPVRLVEGHAENIKITTPADLAFARGLLEERDGVAPAAGASTTRIGIGYDSHRLVEGRRLILGGVLIPYSMGLKGHSDADAVCHALTDAVLGAAALGDIGRHFPDTDPRWKDASSVYLLSQAVALVRDAGWAVANVDVVVVAERPKLAPHIDRMRARLAPVLGVDEGAVSVKGKTNEGMSETGRGEGIVVHAVAMLRCA